MSNDVWALRGGTRNNMLEYVTPYKICVVVLIQELCLLKRKGKFVYSQVFYLMK